MFLSKFFSSRIELFFTFINKLSGALKPRWFFRCVSVSMEGIHHLRLEGSLAHMAPVRARVAGPRVDLAGRVSDIDSMMKE